eukprot:m.243770 g.243770  ORF g.243770 m.243770 type:complete len:359 (-) comp28474_c0_seq1:113-1189(-)
MSQPLRVWAQALGRHCRTHSTGSGGGTKTAAAAARGLPNRWPIAGVEHIVLVSSAKGGVGKSTTAVNLAVALKQVARDKSIGLLDADVYGPSIPKMMNLAGQPTVNDKKFMQPLINYDVKCMSMGFLVEEDAALVWRGLMVMSALERMLYQVSWGRTHVLVIDMPPGTGDTQLTIAQRLPVAGAIVVSTPQQVALADARRGITMFRSVNIPVLGLVQNMSVYHCPNCQHESHIFGRNGCAELAAATNTPLLADVPLVPELCATGDAGTPIVVAAPASPAAQAYLALAARVLAALPAPGQASTATTAAAEAQGNTAAHSPTSPSPSHPLAAETTSTTSTTARPDPAPRQGLFARLFGRA